MKSQVALSDSRDFVSALEGATVKVTNGNFRGLSQLSEEFRFGDLAAQFSRLSASEDFKKEAEAQIEIPMTEIYHSGALFVTLLFSIIATQTPAIALPSLAKITLTTPDWTGKRFSWVCGIFKSRQLKSSKSRTTPPFRQFVLEFCSRILSAIDFLHCLFPLH
jgi:hypothetical protein